MDCIRTMKCAVMALLMVMACTFSADEVAEARDYAELSRDIWANLARIKEQNKTFSKERKAQEAIGKTKADSLKRVIEEFDKAKRSWLADKTDENMKQLEEKREDREKTRAELMEVVADSIIRSLEQIDELQQSCFRQALLFAELGKCIGGSAKEKVSVDETVIGWQLMSSIVISFDLLQQFLEDDSEFIKGFLEDDSLKEMLQSYANAINDEAKQYDFLGEEGLTIERKIQIRIELLKDVTAMLSYIKKSLENRKSEIKSFIIQYLFGSPNKGIDFDGGSLSEDFRDEFIDLKKEISGIENIQKSRKKKHLLIESTKESTKEVNDDGINKLRMRLKDMPVFEDFDKARQSMTKDEKVDIKEVLKREQEACMEAFVNGWLAEKSEKELTTLLVNMLCANSRYRMVIGLDTSLVGAMARAAMEGRTVKEKISLAICEYYRAKGIDLNVRARFTNGSFKVMK